VHSTDRGGSGGVLGYVELCLWSGRVSAGRVGSYGVVEAEVKLIDFIGPSSLESAAKSFISFHFLHEQEGPADFSCRADCSLYVCYSDFKEFACIGGCFNG
jgi:hypothetical protein